MIANGLIVEVTYESEILGSGVFWTGTKSDLPTRNIVATSIARQTFETKEPHARGMWRSRLVGDKA